MTDPRLTRIARTLRKHDTWAEKLVWRWLRDRRFCAYKFRRQHPFGPHLLDFYCVEAKLNIELDGFFHGFPDRKAKDSLRDAWLEARGIKVLRFWNSHLRREAQPIRDTIWRELQERAPHPLPDYCRPMGQSKTGTQTVSEVSSSSSEQSKASSGSHDCRSTSSCSAASNSPSPQGRGPG